MRDTRAAICAADDCRIINRFRQFKHEIEVAAELRLAEISVKGAQTYARTTAIVRLSRQQLKPRRMNFSAAEGWL